MSDSPAISAEVAREFAAAVVRWQRRHGRRDLPWQADADPYKIWLSEIMLQQTRAAAVIPYYERFVRKWPDVKSLSRARLDSVMAAWSGLGYYARARNLHRAAKILARGGFPRTAEGWREIPGVGASTAAAAAAFAFRERAAILDGNVRRVLARAFAMRAEIDSPKGGRELRAVAESLLPSRRDIRGYSQGMMDLGATICVRAAPKCGDCPLSSFCIARRHNLQGELPRRRPRGRKPLRRIAMALVRRGGSLFLERRPPSGVWGGLLSLPESDSAAALKKECEARLQCKLIPRGGGEFAHEFTHFRLRAAVQFWECASAPSAAAAGEWRPLQKTDAAALPSPLKKFLRKLRETE